ncbi:MAG: fumarate hydratase [bacterium]
MPTPFEKSTLRAALLELIRRASSDLPGDVDAALGQAFRREVSGSTAKSAMRTILENVALAREASTPVCQDTGTNIYFVGLPVALPEATVSQAILWATRRATSLGYLRPNVVDPITEKNTGDGVGRENPLIHVHQHNHKSLKVQLLLKGGGCENVSTQFTLPDNNLFAGRDLGGVQRCIVGSAVMAQGRGCSPGIFGVGVGGDRMSSYLVAKRQLLRLLDDSNEDPVLAKLEHVCHRQINSLGIGPMGFGGKTTSLGVKVGVADRLPASYFVSVAYMCWACRRRTLLGKPNGQFTVE